MSIVLNFYTSRQVQDMPSMFKTNSNTNTFYLLHKNMYIRIRIRIILFQNCKRQVKQIQVVY